jgi:signal transduction histidine kinase
VSADADAGHVRIRISDTGPGIDSEFLPHIFEAYRQADAAASRHYGGAGLGLSIAKELVEAHQGQITAESAGPGRGATFVVTLPTTSGEDVPENATASPAAAPR